MSLIKSISGIRGTIGGKPGDGLTPVDIVKFSAAFGTWLLRRHSGKERISVVIGRDARISGVMVQNLVSGTLKGLGIDVIYLGLATTPTVEMAVTDLNADGGIILTASHNPKQWNALKLLNAKGEFISDADGKKILAIAESESFEYADVLSLGHLTMREDILDLHIEKILELPYVDADAVHNAKFKVALDAVNSTGGVAVPKLLMKLGVLHIEKINCEPDGNFAHNPEPLPENLTDLSRLVKKSGAHLGIAVDPDVDRLALVCEDGEMFGEEYTLVAVADFVLQSHPKKNTVSNLSSTRALRDVTEKHGGKYSASAVGEVNVVEMMKSTNAVIGGEGNGGIILPELHYGRDALVGIAVFLTQLAKFGKSTSMLRATYPDYYISKNKIELSPKVDVDKILAQIKSKYKKEKIDLTDGIRIDFEKKKEWVHLRKSNTEPIIRIIAEAPGESSARQLPEKIMADIAAVS